MADIANGRCHDKKAPETGPPLFQHGKLIIQGECEICILNLEDYSMLYGAQLTMYVLIVRCVHLVTDVLGVRLAGLSLRYSLSPRP